MKAFAYGLMAFGVVNAIGMLVIALAYGYWGWQPSQPEAVGMTHFFGALIGIGGGIGLYMEVK